MQKNKFYRFFEPLYQNKFNFLKAIISWLLWSAFLVINVYFIQNFVFIFQNNQVDTLKSFIIYFLIFNIIYFIFSFFTRRWSWADLYYSTIKILHTKYMLQFNKLDNTNIENIWTWKIISILSKWFENWSNFLVDSIWVITKIFISIIATFVILKDLWNLYIIIFFIIFIIINILLVYLNDKAIKYRIWVTEAKINYDRQLVKIVMSKFEILQNNKIFREVNILNKHTDDIISFNNHLNNFLFSMFIIPEIVIFIVYLSVLILSFKLNIWISQIVWIFLMLWILKEVLNNSISFFKNFTKNFYSIEKVWDFFDTTKEIIWLESWEKFDYKNWNIEIKNISFSYEENKVFSDFSLNIIGWKKTAFVWISWSWKTTLIKLISWFLKANDWNIIIDWQPINKINLKSYYKEIWYLTQEPSVFDGTILENLIYWIDENLINDKKIEDCIKLAECSFIYNFKDWLNTEIWEKWVRLSWWQKQRLAIAKLFVKDPKIIILDEPTAALDSFSEESISNSFEKLFIWRTVLIIAHRLQTVKNADDIIVFEWWIVIERWSHNDLVKSNWYYKKMIDLQSGF